MATVYRARDLRLGRPVAVKLLHPFLASKPESAERFLRESKAIARLHHQNIIEIHDASQDPGTKLQYIVMELIEGPTLETFISQHPTRVPEFGLCMVACLCDALEHAHNAGVIHRDIKPENIMFTSEGIIKLMDFGIARIHDAERLTVSGCMLGSPAHMAPEIINGDPYDTKCDIFALGTVLYYVLTNALPFTGSTPAAVFNAILSSDYVRPSQKNNHAVSRACDQIVAKCLELKPEARYKSALALRAAVLEQLKLAGMEDYVLHLKKYFLDPDNYALETIPNIVERFSERANDLFASKKIAASIEILNRILIFEPDNLQAQQLLARIRTSKSIHRAVTGVLSAVLLIGLVGIAIWFYKDIESLADNQKSALHDNLASAAERTSVAQTLPQTQTPQNKDQIPAQPHAPETPQAGETAAPALAATENAPQNEKTPSPIIEPSHETPLPATQNNVPENIAPAPQIDKDSTAQANPNSQKTTSPRTHGPKQKFPHATQPKLQAHASGQNESKNDMDTARNDQNEAQPAEQLVHITQPIFPYDGYAIVTGKSAAGTLIKKSFTPDNKGYIQIELPPGTYDMDLTCDKKCVPKTKIPLVLKASNDGKQLSNVILSFADARLTIKSDSPDAFYFLAFSRKSKSPTRLMPNDAVRFGNFDSYADRLDVTVYKIPTNTELPNYKQATLSKFDKQRVTLIAGELTTITF